MSDWWSDRLSGKPVTPKVAPSPRDTHTPPIVFNAPTPVETLPTMPTPQAQYLAQSAAVDTEQRNDPKGQMSMGEAIRQWQGGEAHRKESVKCPDCGSGNVFSRVSKGSGTAINGVHPAPRCYECGWNGLYDQGIEVNWLS